MNRENDPKTFYEKLSGAVESKAFKFSVFTFIAILIGGLVELPPFFLRDQVKKFDAVTPYNALELAGRDVYQQEGCFYCHTQLIRPFKWETDRWDRNREYGAEPGDPNARDRILLTKLASIPIPNGSAGT